MTFNTKGDEYYIHQITESSPPHQAGMRYTYFIMIDNYGNSSHYTYSDPNTGWGGQCLENIQHYAVKYTTPLPDSIIDAIKKNAKTRNDVNMIVLAYTVSSCEYGTLDKGNALQEQITVVAAENAALKDRLARMETKVETLMSLLSLLK
jgi:hypothetical protein